MTSSLETAIVGRKLRELSRVLTDLTTALETGRAEAVQQVESRLANAVDSLKRHQEVPALSVAGAEAPEDLSAIAREIRARVSACRRLGGTVPALMSVMYPGETLYGRHGLQVGRMAVRPALTQVL